MQQEPSPILKTWRNVYALVIGLLVVIIIALYFLTDYFK